MLMNVIYWFYTENKFVKFFYSYITATYLMAAQDRSGNKNIIE